MTDRLVNTALEISYDGRAFDGWQRHGRRATVQGAMEAGVREAFGIEQPVNGSGRTDRGAHALGQVASVLLPADSDPSELPDRINRVLAEGVAVERAARVPEDFHARHSAIAKTYRYALWNDDDLPLEYEHRVWHVHGDLDVDAMRASLGAFEGRHDFASFASKAGHVPSSTERTMHECTLLGELPVIEIAFTAEGFLYKMVRNLVRAVVKVGEGRYEPSDLARILEQRSRAAAPGSAPASGLYLDAVYYDPPVFRSVSPEADEPS